MKIITILMSIFLLVGCGQNSHEVFLKERHHFSIDSSVRAITYFDNVIGFAGSQGVFGLIDLHKLTLNHSVQKHQDIFPEFRAVAATSSDFFMLSAGNPALLYKTEPHTMQLVYTQNQENTFFNAMKFRNEKEGFAVGDPDKNGFFQILKTHNGGKNWYVFVNLPLSETNEHLFAASNSCLSVSENTIRFVTGGATSHFYTLIDTNWEKYPLPLQSGTPWQGAYSVDFFNDKQGIVAGGDSQNPQTTQNNLALTFDGGKTWKNVANSMGYISCIQYLPQTNGKEIIATGTSGIWYSSDQGKHWKKLSDEEFYAITCIDTQRFVVSKDKTIKIFELIKK